ncbi:MAG: GNAT family N-acyltransferase [Planktotalea sp.]|uniref:GNAT family N-acetyltransferase n=1 Tax=Planktotalea sp. TaxID=2029877 RepID=UPI003C70A3F8
MTLVLQKGRLRARQSKTTEDIAKALSLRALAFGCDDRDALDDLCAHILIENEVSGEVLCCFRMLSLQGKEMAKSYSAQFYELSALERFDGPMVELGRFCTHPCHSNDPDVLRLAWGAMTAFVDAHQVELLFGCSSFAGTETASYLDSFAMLKERHLAPKRWLPRVKAPNVFRYAAVLRNRPDMKRAMRAMPPLLRTYLLMGGWVSDHAVVDEKMNTLHVFTGVEISAIPDARKRLLRAVVG